MSELYHYGVPGQKHGNRKYQYEDGSLTPEGKIHYGVGDGRKKTSVLIKPGEKPNVIKKAVDQTKKDFKEVVIKIISFSKEDIICGSAELKDNWVDEKDMPSWWKN